MRTGNKIKMNGNEAEQHYRRGLIDSISPAHLALRLCERLTLALRTAQSQALIKPLDARKSLRLASTLIHELLGLMTSAPPEFFTAHQQLEQGLHEAFARPEPDPAQLGRLREQADSLTGAWRAHIGLQRRMITPPLNVRRQDKKT